MLEWFYQLNSQRPPGFDSPAPISYGEFQAWANLKKTNPRPEEVEALVAMDNAFIQAIHDFRESQREPEKKPNG